MKSSKFYLSAFLIISVIIIAAVFVACGGGGGGSSSGSAAPASGSVAVMLADGPLEDLQQLNIWITKVSLLRADNGQEVVVFEDDLSGLEVDILNYREYDYLLTVNQEVPVGTYNKVRLEVSKVEAVGGDCGVENKGIEIKLPSGKIDLNPRGAFQVVEGEALVIRLDIDAKKSFLLHKAGNSGKCIFRPVIFVDIKPVDKLDSCPEVLKGRIVSLKYSLGSVTGFVLDLNRGDLLQVSIDSDTVIFDENGSLGDKGDIELRKPAYVRGRIQTDGSLLASLVVMGDVLKVKGTATEAVVVDQYTMTLDPYQELIGTSVEVGLAEGSIILVDCDTTVDRNYIRQGVRTTVIGKYDTGNSVLRAVVVIVEPREIIGRLTSISSASGGNDLTIQPATDSASAETVFLPAGQNVYLQGDRVVALSRLQDLISCNNSNIQVRVLVDPAIDKDPPTTKKVYVIPDQRTSNVDSVGIYTISLDDGYIVDVETDATIIKKTDGNYFHIELSDIQHGNEVTVFGLDNCKNSNHFYGYIVVVED